MSKNKNVLKRKYERFRRIVKMQQKRRLMCAPFFGFRWVTAYQPRQYNWQE